MNNLINFLLSAALVAGIIFLLAARLKWVLAIIEKRQPEKKRHLATTIIGVIAIMLGAWSAVVLWVPDQSVYFNCMFREIPSFALLACGWIGLHAADGRHVK